MQITVNMPDPESYLDSILEDGDTVLADGVTREDAVKVIAESFTAYAENAVAQQRERDDRQGQPLFSSDESEYWSVFAFAEDEARV